MKARIASLAVAAVAAMAPGALLAQPPPMDMSWALQSQAQLWQQGQAAAMAAGQACYNAMLQLRMQGYTGPLDCGANQQTLQNSINGLNQAQQDYIQNGMINSWRTDRAVNNWDMGAVRGCGRGWNAYGQPVWICP